MNYPGIAQYKEAITYASDNLKELSGLTPVLDGHGEPLRSSGACAVVFKMEDGDGRYHALKCFITEQDGREDAYRLISGELEYVNSPYIAHFQYYENEIFVDGEEYPVLLMDWVDGETMDHYVGGHYRDSTAMADLCVRFGKMAEWLHSQPFAHGDIKPDNIMVGDDGRSLALIDYDGMYVPAMKGRKSPTLGTPSFKHLERTENDFDENIDDFALASIALSLRAISLDPSLMDRYGKTDRLLFTEDDYRNIGASQVFQSVSRYLYDKPLQTLMSLFLISCAQKNLASVSGRLFGGLQAEPVNVRVRVGGRRVVQVPKPKYHPVIQELLDSMVYVEGGTFTMGATPEQADDAYDWEKPAHKVTLSGFRISKYEVTQALWEHVTGVNPSGFKGDDKRPVECVSWNDCQEFIVKLNRETGKRFRLPTEAEWEYAARGGNESKGYKYSGSDDLDEVAWYWDNSGSATHPVGQKKQNELGLYDMSGNVWEWCQDWYGSYCAAAQTNPAGPSSGDFRVGRGGSWGSDAWGCRCSCRLVDPGIRFSILVLRLVLSE